MQPKPFKNSYMFDFEAKFDYETVTQQWIVTNWIYSIYSSIGYVILVFGIRQFMRNRTEFRLKGLLITWNIMLAMFSLAGFIRTVPELLTALNKYGLYHSICISSFTKDNPVFGFWSWLFVLSKLPELGDTVFIVLRKRPLIFLHWYHHITVLMATWFTYSAFTPYTRWFIVINYLVHSVMYSYYAVRAMGFRVPIEVSMFITASQLVQMMIGCIMNYTAYIYITADAQQSCQVSKLNVFISFTMYLSHFVLFSRFFYNVYILKSKSGRVSTIKKPSKQH